jgi:hypothetical protein
MNGNDTGGATFARSVHPHPIFEAVEGAGPA